MSEAVDPQVTGEIAEVRAAVRRARAEGLSIGCVPTMGALHAGHLSLIDECRRRSRYVVVTIFVNPTQFGPHEDLSRYPRPLEQDLAACARAGVDLVFTPNVSALYPTGFDTWVNVDRLSAVLEGAHRPGHFRGVATIVLKLFHIVQPDLACFGAKDYQQQTLIRRMVRDLDMPIEIVVCPTVREADGLALSSRNAYLSQTQRQSALSLSQGLSLAEDRLCRGDGDIASIQQDMLGHLVSFPDVAVDYAVIADPDSLEPLRQVRTRMVVLVAARVGETRLIDNKVVVINE